MISKTMTPNELDSFVKRYFSPALIPIRAYEIFLEDLTALWAGSKHRDKVSDKLSELPPAQRIPLLNDNPGLVKHIDSTDPLAYIRYTTITDTHSGSLRGNFRVNRLAISRLGLEPETNIELVFNVESNEITVLTGTQGGLRQKLYRESKTLGTGRFTLLVPNLKVGNYHLDRLKSAGNKYVFKLNEENNNESDNNDRDTTD